MTREIPAKAEELLTREPRIAHLATSHDNRPHVAPLWYNYRAGLVEIVTTGRKLTNIRQNPRVAMSIQQDHEGHPEWGVSLRGTASVVEDDAADEIFRRINRRYDADDDAWRDENTPVQIDVASVEYWDY